MLFTIYFQAMLQCSGHFRDLSQMPTLVDDLLFSLQSKYLAQSGLQPSMAWIDRRPDHRLWRPPKEFGQTPGPSKDVTASPSARRTTMLPCPRRISYLEAK